MASAKPTAVISTSTSDISSLPNITFGFIEATLERHDQKAASKEMSKGYKYFCEKYLKDIKVYNLSAEDEGFRITAKCFRSQKKNETPHEIEIWLREGPVFEKESSKCSCAIGMSGLCGHISGLLYTLAHMKMNNITSIPCDIVKTSLPQTWHIPRGEKIGSSRTDNLHLHGYNLQNPKQPTRGLQSTLYNPLVSSNPLVPVADFCTRLDEIDKECLMLSVVEKYPAGPGSEIVDTRFGKFFKGSPIGIQQKLSKDYMLNLLDVGDFIPLPARNVMLDNFSTVLTNQQTSAFSSIKINMDECHHIEEMTRLQSLDPKWHAVRRDRITASVAGDIAKRRADYEPLVTRLKSTRKIVTENMKYGLASEPIAVNAYVQVEDLKVNVYPCGIVVNPYSPWLAASPDRKIFNANIDPCYGLLEIKCPVNKLEDCKYLCKLGGQLSLKRNHNYFYQVMMQLAVTGLEWCHFFVWRPDEHHLEVIKFDQSIWNEMKNKLDIFFFNYYL